MTLHFYSLLFSHYLYTFHTTSFSLFAVPLIKKQKKRFFVGLAEEESVSDVKVGLRRYTRTNA